MRAHLAVAWRAHIPSYIRSSQRVTRIHACSPTAGTGPLARETSELVVWCSPQPTELQDKLPTEVNDCGLY